MTILVLTILCLFKKNESLDLVKALGHRVLATVLFKMMHLFRANLNLPCLPQMKEPQECLKEGVMSI